MPAQTDAKRPPFMAKLRDNVLLCETFFEVVLPEALDTRREHSATPMKFVWVLMDRFYESAAGTGGYCADAAEELGVAGGTAASLINFMLEHGLIENRQNIGRARLLYPTQLLLDRLEEWKNLTNGGEGK